MRKTTHTQQSASFFAQLPSQELLCNLLPVNKHLGIFGNLEIFLNSFLTQQWISGPKFFEFLLFKDFSSDVYHVEMRTSVGGENGPNTECHILLPNPYPRFGFDSKVKSIAYLITQVL